METKKVIFLHESHDVFIQYIWKGLCHQNGKRQRVLTLRLIPL